MKKIFLLLVAIALFAINSSAQITGSFTDAVLFNSQSRTISCFVPANYDSTANYQLMICLHGMGDNSDNYRNALISSLSWNTVFPNTIFICPDGGDDANSDFSSPAGDEAIIQKSIDYARLNYKIDSTKIILQGFSLGGRSALKYGMDHPVKFKGLLLNTPAVQGLDDALNLIPGIGVYYNYTNTPKLPIYITYGGDDVIYQYTIDKIHDILKKNNAIVKVIPVAGMAHTIPNSTITSPCIPFFNNPFTAAYDLDIFEINLAERICNPVIAPKVFVRNLGSNTITSFNINYQLNSTNGSFNWIGNIAPYEYALVSLPQLTAVSGSQSLDVSIGTINNQFTDSMLTNNQLSKSFKIEDHGTSCPLTEGFDGNYDNWIFPKTGSLFEWYQDDQVFHTGSASIGSFNTALLFYTSGDVESFLSPVMDLSSVSNPKLTFDYAYNYHKYTPPYVASETFFADTLEILISTDCGTSFTSLFKKGGAGLATDTVPILNPLTLQACFFIPTASQWKNKIIDLSNYANEPNAIIKFSYISNMGGSINIDNINFGNNLAVIENDLANEVSIYPNPSRDKVNIQYTAAENAKMKVYNIVGACVLQGNLHSGTNKIAIDQLTKGVYLIEISIGNRIIKKKLMKDE